MFRYSRTAAAVLFAAVACAAHGADAPGMAAFESGVAHYRAARFEAALADFLEARRQGLALPNLTFNLGLTYYRLRRYPESRAQFEQLRTVPGYDAAVEFHLGLIAARLGQRDRAAKLWRGVDRDGATAGLRERAEVALDRLDGAAAAAVPGAYLLAGAAYDSNPALVDEGVQAGSAASAGLDLFGAFDVPVKRAAASAWVVNGGAYARDYVEDNGLDQYGLLGGLSHARRSGERMRAVSVDASAGWLDGEHFVDTFSADVRFAPAPGASGLSLRGQAAYVAAAQPYAHLDGWRLRLEPEATVGLGRARLRAGYQFELNDRADRAAGAEFFSQSPLRHRFTLGLDHGAGPRWRLQWQARYRHSWFREPNRFFDGGVLGEQRRVEGLFQAGVQARRRLGRRTNALLEYQYSHNAATIDVFGYERHFALAGLEWAWRGRD